ncbi:MULTISPECIES: MarR family transcriptional regulator [Kitasatospora]|uniref:Putative MarR family transcriptional regulator n=1 Tax=Kitasatospora setae (strain ATCC 33774 / DSM 43861 / JCM 3304 / KCC A-0304 / NBRC 14216 / KM-6054) TaxID=452652 RepID=E4N0A6_KITSK|nr:MULTISPECIES: MarR family transcriptional regulator [Kitasatospora]BAJ31434.1 putative MarR family transcriptional regulator [Kitasatospora setae KM-6054]
METAEHARMMSEIRLLVLAAQREGSRQLGHTLKQAGITPAQSEVLEVLAEGERLTLAEVGRRLVCEAGSPSRLVDSLVKAGLVARTPSPTDRRTVLLAITPEGHAKLTELADTAAPLLAHMSGRLDQYEARALADLLRRLLDGTPGGAAVAARFPVPARS